MADDSAVDAPRKVWDLEEAERQYEERLEREREEAKDAKKKKAAGGKLAPPSTGNANSVQARTEAVIKTEELRGKRELVAPTTGIGNKGRSAGFYCEVCDLTYKDSFSYLDHINSSNRNIFLCLLIIRLSTTGYFWEGGACNVGGCTSSAGVA
jgi:hypothetical protein